MKGDKHGKAERLLNVLERREETALMERERREETFCIFPESQAGHITESK